MRTLLKHAYRPEEAKPKNATNILHDKDAKARDAGLLYSPKIRELQSANEVSWSFNSGSSLDRLLTDFNTLQLQVKKKTLLCGMSMSGSRGGHSVLFGKFKGNFLLVDYNGSGLGLGRKIIEKENYNEFKKAVKQWIKGHYKGQGYNKFKVNTYYTVDTENTQFRKETVSVTGLGRKTFYVNHIPTTPYWDAVNRVRQQTVSKTCGGGPLQSPTPSTPVWLFCGNPPGSAVRARELLLKHHARKQGIKVRPFRLDHLHSFRNNSSSVFVGDLG